jgi:thiosulfate/3-mercaptopyruvate sulfurtransferase
MATFVSADWVEERLGGAGILPLDPRSAMRYLQGHLKSAVNLPLRKLLDSDGRLLAVGQLAESFGRAGLGSRQTPLLYDSHDGRNAAMVAWVLEYLGRDDVLLMDLFFEHWKAQGREVFYRPVPPEEQPFVAQVNPGARATLADVSNPGGFKLVDTRSREEYIGTGDTDARPGHIPGALNVVWQDLVGRDGPLLRSDEEVRQMLAAAGVQPTDHVVTYCRTGVRAAVGYLAFRRLGFDVSLYDGSYAEWERSGLPVE